MTVCDLRPSYGPPPSGTSSANCKGAERPRSSSGLHRILLCSHLFVPHRSHGDFVQKLGRALPIRHWQNKVKKPQRALPGCWYWRGLLLLLLLLLPPHAACMMSE